MSNRDEHFAAGIIGGLLTGLIYQLKRYNEGEQQTFGEAVFNVTKCAFVGGLSASLPDTIEPADNPNHRGIAHSLLTAGIITYAEYKMIEADNIPIWLEEILASAANGYLSHLLLDSRTPKRLPLLG